MHKCAAAVVALTSSLTLLAAPSALSAPGNLDTSFDGDGRVTANLARRQSGASLAVQPDGKIIVGGNTRVFTTYGWRGILVRHDSTGALDPTFGVGGVQRLNRFFVAGGFALQDDGKIVVAGSQAGSANLAVWRLNADGSPDTSFSADGLAENPDFAGHGGDVAVQPDGRIVVTGTSYSQGEGGNAGIVRFEADGDVDQSFGDGGIETPSAAGIYSSASAVQVESNGKIVVSGLGVNIPGSFAVVIRLDADGHIDASFGGGDGVVRTHFGKAPAYANDLALQADGRIVTVGLVGSGRNIDFAVMRFTKGGKPDTTFSRDGKRRVDFTGGVDVAVGVAIQPNGRIVVAGAAAPRNYPHHQRFGVARLRAGGSLDLTFGRNGKTKTRFGSNDRDFGEAVALQADGRILVGGSVQAIDKKWDFGVARYLVE